MKKRIISLLTTLVMVVGLVGVVPAVSVGASSVIEDAISWAISIANDNSHGYSKSNRWGPNYDCSSFVISAFKSAGIDTGATYTGNMRSKFTQCGFTWIPWSQIGGVSNLIRGDILLNESTHTELYLGNNQMVGAHSAKYAQADQISVVGYSNSSNWGGVLRYDTPSTPPTNVVLSRNQIWYDIQDTITLYPSSDGGTSYFMSVVKDGQTIISTGLNGEYSFSASQYGYGNYYAWITASNSAGSTDSAGIEFGVVREAAYSDVSVSKPIYELSDTILISVSTVCAKGQVIGIDKEGVGRVITESCDSTYTISANKLGVGKYSAYFSVYNGSGGVDTQNVEFVIAEPLNLGDNFYARIKNTTANKYLTVSNSNVLGELIDCSKNQIWNFIRQSDGSYKIISTVDNKSLDVDNYASGGNGSNVQVYNDWGTDNTAQRFKIFKAYDSYYIKPLCCDMFIDMDISGDNNVSVWGGGVNWAPQKFEIIKIDNSDIGTHNYTSAVTTQATCTSTGVKTYTCSVCGDSYTETISKTAHKYSSTWTIDKAVTCTAEGSKSHHCTVCGSKTDVTVIPKTAHTYDSGKITTVSTCTTDGIKTYTCAVCGATKTETVPKTGHTIVIDKAIAPTDMQSGKTEGSHCSVCGEIIKEQEIIPKLGHDYNVSSTTPATCTSDGVIIYTCSTCGDTYNETIPSTGHKSVTDKAQSATCAEDGKTEGSHCSVCGEIIKEQEIIPKLGHDYNVSSTTTATCTSDGIITYTCSTCGDTYSETIPATGHIYEDIVHKVTCTEQGYTLHTCSVCGDSYKDNYTNYIPTGVLMGDINLDGKITTADVGLANAHAKNTKLLNNEQFKRGDMNGDGKVSTADVGLINAYAKGTKKYA